MDLNLTGGNKIPSGSPAINSSEEQDKVAVNADEGQSKTPVEESDDASLNEEYIDKRIIIISPVLNYPLYRKVNMKAMGQRRESIGGCIATSRTLPSNKEEMAAYMPGIIGYSPNHPDFVKRVKDWFDNISFAVSEDNTELDASFRYNHKKDYLEIQKKEDAIKARYQKVDHTNIKAIKDALKIMISELNALESTKYKYGEPINTEQYLIYRHCLLYRQVAKDTALINSDPSIRFYIKDQDREERKAKQLVFARKKAMQNFIELGTKDDKYAAVYVQVTIANGQDIGTNLAKERTEQDVDMMDFVNKNPEKFNKFVTDKDLMMKSFIEMLIAKGELVRTEYNQQISTADGEFIAPNMKEAIVYFNNPANTSKLQMYKMKLKLM